MSQMKRNAALAIVGSALLGACGSSATMSTTMGDAQTPPMGEANLLTWLAGGAYKSWHCEPAARASRPPAPHGFARVCSNALVSSNAAGTGTWPEGASEVKELFAAITDTTPTNGYAVSLKTSADSAMGANWYFYERAAGTLFSDGLGTSVCVSCHMSAGTTGFTPTPNGRDFIYTPVP